MSIKMLASSPKQLVVHNDTLKWEEYSESIEQDTQKVRVSADSTLFVTWETKKKYGQPQKIRVWNSLTFQIIGKIYCYNAQVVSELQISPNNKWIMYYTYHGVYVFETYKLNNTPIFEYKIWNIEEGILATFTSDSIYIITGGVGTPMMIHNITDQSQKPMPIDCGSEEAIDIQCCRNMLFIAKVGKRISIVNTCSHKNVQNWLSKGQVQQISLSNDEKTFATIGIRDTIKLWSTQTRKLIRKYGKYLDSFGGVNLSKDGQLMISNSHQEDCLLWNMPSGECITFEKYICSSTGYKFSQDGKFIIRNQYSQKAKIWEVSVQYLNQDHDLN